MRGIHLGRCASPTHIFLRLVFLTAVLLCPGSAAWGADTILSDVGEAGSLPQAKPTWGLGFRVLQSGTGFQIKNRDGMFVPWAGGIEIHVRRMVSDRASVGLAAAWFGSYSDMSSSADQGLISRSEKGSGSAKAFVPVEWILKRRGPVAATASFGPMYELAFNAVETESLDPNWQGVGVTYSERFAHQLGATAGLGIRWEFARGIAVATSFGADAWYSFGSETQDPWISDDRTVESKGFGTRSWFGGVGLDTWF